MVNSTASLYKTLELRAGAAYEDGLTPVDCLTERRAELLAAGWILVDEGDGFWLFCVPAEPRAAASR